MKRALILVFGIWANAWAYSGPDLNGTIDVHQIATSVFLYADEHGGKIDIPYSEIPSVKLYFQSLTDRGTFAFAPHASYSARVEDPVPVVFYSIGNMVAVGFGDGSHRYYETEDRPPWVGLRDGFSLWEWTIGMSLLANLIAVLYFGGNWIQKKIR